MPDQPARSRFAAALLGLLLALLGVPAYLLSMDEPWLRASGAAAFAPMALGTVLAVRAVGRDRGWRVRWLAALTVLVTALWTVAFTWLAALPEAGSVARIERAPDFALRDQDGREVRLHERCAQGPVLLVFFRGHW